MSTDRTAENDALVNRLHDLADRWEAEGKVTGFRYVFDLREALPPRVTPPGSDAPPEEIS